MTVLQVADLAVSHGQLRAVDGVTLTVEPGHSVAVVGANGAGKSTLLRALVGLHRPERGRVVLDGADLAGVSTAERVRRGLVMVPEGRRLFSSLSVEENLRVGLAAGRTGEWDLGRVYQLFGWMPERRRQPAGSLSGGQQQAVAIGRALMANPEVLLLDELSLGLAPVVVKQIYGLLPDLLRQGMSVLLVEQDVTQAQRVADRMLCLLEGRVTLEGPPSRFTPAEVEAAYFGFSQSPRAS